MESLRSLRVIIAAGGTAGHINPGLAIADKVKHVFPESSVLFVGSPVGMEAELVKKAGYDFAPIKMFGLQRKMNIKNMARNFKALYYYLNANKEAAKLIKKFGPDIVVGTGGYVSLPVVQAAAKLGIKTASHESNSLPGIATKMMAKFVNRLFLGDADAMRHIQNVKNCIVTGNPTRTNIPMEERSAARRRLGLPDGLTILSTGGSNGANVISEAVAALLAWETREGNINHIHSYGRNGKEVFGAMLEKYGVSVNPERMILREYIDNMYTCYSAADLVICRAGSMTQTELKAAGRASIQIPWPGAAENHQYYNAKSMVDKGAAILTEESELTPEKLISIITGLTANPEKLRKMEECAAGMVISNSADIIVGEIVDLVYK